MPGDAVTLSLVLVVHREQAYVGEFATSVLDQDFRDVEIVAVDDASPDHAPAVLDEIAARDTRLRVHHLPARVGLGAARDLGLAQARGEYVWFVHTPDLMPPGGPPALRERPRPPAPPSPASACAGPPPTSCSSTTPAPTSSGASAPAHTRGCSRGWSRRDPRRSNAAPAPPTSRPTRGG